jgi:hypothetical protein
MKSANVTRATSREKQHTIMGSLEGIIKRLGNFWEMFAKGKFGDDV